MTPDEFRIHGRELIEVEAESVANVVCGLRVTDSTAYERPPPPVPKRLRVTPHDSGMRPSHRLRQQQQLSEMRLNLGHSANTFQSLRASTR